MFGKERGFIFAAALGERAEKRIFFLAKELGGMKSCYPCAPGRGIGGGEEEGLQDAGGGGRRRGDTGGRVVRGFFDAMVPRNRQDRKAGVPEGLGPRVHRD